MKASKIFDIALENMKQRKLRTSLTTLGVIIGITAIIGLASLGEGFRAGIKERMQTGFELDVLVILPIGSSGAREPFTPDEVNSIRNVSGVSFVAPFKTVTQAKLFNQDNKTLNAFTVAAVNFTEITRMLPERFKPLEGKIPDSEENDSIMLGYKTCFINETTLAHLNENVTMQIALPPPMANITKNFRVSAILSKSGASALTNFDYWAFIPANALNQLGKEEYNIILVKVENPEKSEEVALSIEKVFENPYAVSIVVPTSFMRQVDNILNFVQIFLMTIAGISLLVAGIGIMNIMTVSVMERTREIGILKAIGAKSRTVLAMFLSEALLIGVIGGLIGMLTGYGASYGFAYILSNFVQSQQRRTAGLGGPEEPQSMTINPLFSPEWTVVAFVFAIVVCVIFGLYPARKASKLNPVEALRYE
ncbi:MAG: FtsX-like permease family protein [Candidatus Bathyarchaeia archaeon]